MNTNVVLVTGCAGFIGSHLAENLLQKGNIVVGIDNIDTYYDVSQKKSNLNILKEFDSFIFYKQDLCNADGLKKIFTKHSITHVAHLAGKVGVRDSIENPFNHIHSNLLATTILLDCIKDFSVKNIVITSSSSVYGDSENIPFKEDSNDTNKPISQYATTKKACELMCHTYHNMYGLPITILRLFTVYGPRGRPDMIPLKFLNKAYLCEEIVKYGDGQSKRDYTFIDDVTNALIVALEKPLGFEIINIGTSNPVSLNKFIDLVGEVSEKKLQIKTIKLQLGDVDTTCADISKAEKLLGYSPKVSLKEGLQKTYEWMCKLKR